MKFYSVCQKKHHGFVFICCCCFFQGWSYRTNGTRILQEGSFKRKLKNLVSFISDQKIGGQLAPVPRPFFLKAVWSKFWDSIWIDMSSEMTWPLRTTRGRAASYEICPLFTYSICYWEVYRHFPREEGDLLGMDFLWGEFPIGMEVSGGELFRGNFTWGEFTRICIQNVCYLSFFSLLIPLYM